MKRVYRANGPAFLNVLIVIESSQNGHGHKTDPFNIKITTLDAKSVITIMNQFNDTRKYQFLDCRIDSL